MNPQSSAPPASRKRWRVLAAVAAVSLLGLTATACRVPKRFDVATVVDGLSNPWDLAFTPDGAMIITERPGPVGVFRNGAYTRFNPITDVVASSEGGMMGVAVDPAFATNRRIYTCYMTAGDVRVVRWDVSADWTTLGSGTPLITGIPRTSGRHSGCRTRFGPDGYLWVTTGDAATGTNPQNPQSLGGKVLRIDTDGNPAAGNMAAPFLPQIYAYGFRNPQGISFRLGDGTPFLVEHGTDCDDEITPIAAGGNGGWDPIGGNGYNEARPMTDLTKFPNALRPAWSSGCPTIAPSGGTFVSSDAWGDFKGQMIFAVLKDQELRRINLADGAGDRGDAIVRGQGRLRVAVEGPNGTLYVLTDANPGKIFTVTPVL